MMDNEILTLLSPNISHLVIYLIREGTIGICNGQIKVTEFNSSKATKCMEYSKCPFQNNKMFIMYQLNSGCCPTVIAENQGKCDRFKVVLPYAGQTITWEVLFNCNYPEDPPDFIFGSEDVDFFPNIENIKSLIDWDYKEPSSLLRVIEELLQEYRKHQERLISESQRLQFEYNSLIQETDIESGAVEIHVSRSENRIGPINFLIKLPVDFARIPAFIVKLNPGEDAAILLVSFNSAEGSRITPQLYLSPRVEKALGGAANLRIPGFPSGTCLSEYVPDVVQLLKTKVDQIVQCFEKRKEYMSAFLSLYGRSVLEYDTETFTKISFLFEWNDFFFIIYIDLPSFFPKAQPVVTFQSIYHENKGKPFHQSYQDYPYSPRWSGLEMAERTKAFILEQIGLFQKDSVGM